MSYFNWNVIQDNVNAFGNVFKSITIKRVDSTNQTVKEINVPIAYSNGSQYIERYRRRGDDPTNIKDLINITLPRMAFKLIDLKYDAERKLNRKHKLFFKSDLNVLDNIDEYTINDFSEEKIEEFTTNKMVRLYTPVPYVLTFQLYILTNREEDSNQILEQILPVFSPDINIPVSYIFGPKIKISTSTYRGRAKVTFDSPLTLESVSKDDSYDGNFEKKERRILHTLTFNLRAKFFADFENEKIIKNLQFNFSFSEEKEKLLSLYVMPTEENLTVNLNTIIDFEKLYNKFFDDMYQDPYDEYNLGDENGLV